MYVVIRPKELGLLHVRELAFRQLHEDYYTHRNLYPYELPPSSQTYLVDNPQLRNELMDFVMEKVESLRGLSMQIEKVYCRSLRMKCHLHLTLSVLIRRLK